MAQVTSVSTDGQAASTSTTPTSTRVLQARQSRLTETRHLQLANALQSSLDIDEILAIFSKEVTGVVYHEYAAYRNRRERIAAKVGADGCPHQVSYQIVLRDSDLGELLIGRSSPFDEDDTDLLERLICALIYPLRNALLYKRALDTAHTDPVTGAQNRASLDLSLVRDVDLAHRHGSPLALIMVDIDHFKRINDDYGHINGDQALRDFVACLNQCVRRSDIVYRYGGEEFLVVLANTDLGGARLLAQRIRQSVEETEFLGRSKALCITASLGVACLRPGESAAALTARVDRALYQAKAAGRNRVVAALG